MSGIEVRHEHGDRFAVLVRDHELVVDQPADAGAEAGPTPTELFVASLAACVGFYAERFMKRHDVDPAGLRVDCDFDMSSERPARVSAIELKVVLPDGFPEARREALMRVVEHCTVHNSIRHAPTIRTELAAAERV